MTWTHTDTIAAMGSWGLVSLLCSVVGNRCKPGPVRTGLLAFAAIGPLDVMRAWRVWTAVLFVALLTHCGGSAQDAKTAMALETYGNDELACVTLNDTKDAAVDCIKQVQARWCGDGGWLREAGACGLQDGGTDR